ncbi:hypothetical protein HDU98_006046 [Podochytrium sp. JEL0797]|nr:hypothetical protein HDU98_006046 [Podochytrium sp. JEL0797]
MSVRKIPVTIVTDTICPWCYVGEKRFDSAVTKYKQIKGDSVAFEITYKPFQLDPTLPREGRNKLENYHRKFGKARFDQMNDNLSKVGKSIGINFSFGGNVGNTLDSHRLIAFAGTLGTENQHKVIQSLYSAYFENEKNLGDVEVLVQAGKAGGVDEKIVREQIYGGDLLKAETIQAEQEIRDAGISSVPYFIFDGKYAISGGQEPETFIEVFDNLVKL